MTLQELRDLIETAANALPPDSEVVLTYKFDAETDSSTPTLEISYPGPITDMAFRATLALPGLGLRRGFPR